MLLYTSVAYSLIACTSNTSTLPEEIENQSYCKNAHQYLTELTEVSTLDNSQYYLLGSFDYCSPCLESSINFLLENRKTLASITVVVSGKTKSGHFLNNVLEDDRLNIIVDKNNLASQYDLGIYKPLLVSYQNDNCSIHKRLNSENYHEVLSTTISR